jgi:formylglycine-generating enzyme
MLSTCQTRSSQLTISETSLVLIPEGWFLMGSDTGPQSARPAHNVFLSSYQIAMTEVTVDQFRRYVEESGNVPLSWAGGAPPLDLNLPVTGILWKEAVAYCDWYGFRLPTEAEWEKAARGSDGRAYPWGSTWHGSLANTEGSGPDRVTRAGAYPDGASPYGLLDMSGNAQEWVADYFDPTYYQTSPTHDPKGPQTVLDHVLRGGSWASPHGQATTFFRDSSHSVMPNNRVGFRCAADVAVP